MNDPPIAPSPSSPAGTPDAGQGLPDGWAVLGRRGRPAVERPERLAALAETGLLDSPAEEGFDRISRLASRLLGAPVVLVSLVDRHRQFFKSAIGLAEPWASRRETPLSHSFCQYVTNDEPLVVEDARGHPLVRSNGAIRDLGVVAYAGFPVRSVDGEVLGSFCAIDGQPRPWSEEDLATLEDLAEAVATEIRLRDAVRRSARRAREAEAAAVSLRAVEASLRHAVRARDELVSIVSHDLRNPLNVIALNSDLVRAGVGGEARERCLSTIDAAIARADRLLKDLLDVARIEVEGLSLTTERTAVAPLLADAHAAYAALAADHGVRLEITAPKLPLAIQADSGRLLQVLGNLITNALHHTPEGGCVRCSVVAAGPAAVRFVVADSGCGMSDDEVEHVFDRFWRADRKRRTGAGLGLAIVKGIVEAHDGRIEVESTPGAGTSFSFWIPTAPPGIPAPPIA